MLAYLAGLEVPSLVRVLICIHTLCVQEVKTFVSLCICTDSPELSLLDNAISEGLDLGGGGGGLVINIH